MDINIVSSKELRIGTRANSGQKGDDPIENSCLLSISTPVIAKGETQCATITGAVDIDNIDITKGINNKYFTVESQ